MYKVIIVDDESLIIDSLRLSIDWQKEGFEIIGTALDSLHALELIRQYGPDIVFTDIRMPGISGIELIKKASEINPDTLFVIISGYAEFAYAQKALKYNAIGYCLKPFDEEEILCILSKAKNILQKVKHTENSNLPGIMDFIAADEQQKAVRVINEAGLSMDGGSGITIVVSIGPGKLSMPGNIACIQMSYDFNKKVYLLQSPNVEVLEQYLAWQLSEDVISIGIVPGVKQAAALKTSITEAIIAAYQFFVTGTKGVYIAKQYDTRALSHCLKALEDAIWKKDASIVDESFNQMISLFERGSLNIRNAFKVYHLITVLLSKYQEEDEDTNIDDYEQLMAAYENVRTMLDDLRHLAVKHCTVSDNEKLEEIDNTVVKRILEYIESNYYKSFTIQQLSEMFFISPNYISFLFKKAVGETYKNYISKLRIAHACNLLENSSYSVQEIGEKVGYNDYFYFIRVFKSMKGISPSKYREEFRGKK